jgi:L-ascorbate metabolism protein UlaG (beta-lactamase superfamily)
MDPEQAAAAVALIRPGVAVPIHYGTFSPIGAAGRHLRRVGDPARDFVARVAQAAPDIAVRVLAPGESLALGGA